MTKKLKPVIPNLTVICVAGNQHGKSIASLYKAINEIDAARYLFLTNIDISASGIECINVGGLDTWEKYNHFIIKELYKYFDTEFCILVQWDGVILDGSLWSEDFLKYSYIGAAWLNGECGNGGLSIRSHHLMKAVALDDFVEITTPEDNCICILYKRYLQKKYNITYAPKEVCDRFSFELNQPLQPTFGKHAFHWKEFKETVVIKRDFALGDVLLTEPVMHYFHKKGFEVALETNPENYAYFADHYFPIVPRAHLNPNLPVKVIDLNMAYEVFPNQNHLISYFKFAQIPQEEWGTYLRNPILSLSFNYKHPTYKLFKKYTVLHIDKRDEEYRNQRGIDWGDVVDYLKQLGYIVIQVGNGEHEIVEGAIEMRTPTGTLLKWLVASSDMFVGIDSGVSHIASAFEIPSAILFGSVNPNSIHYDISKKVAIHNHLGKGVCNKPFCWNNSIGTNGTPCYIDNDAPPCTEYTTEQVIKAIDELLEQTKKKHYDAVSI